jgi:hypothetical protein
VAIFLVVIASKKYQLNNHFNGVPAKLQWSEGIGPFYELCFYE